MGFPGLQMETPGSGSARSPRLRVEFAEPGKSIAEYGPKKKWSRVAEAVRTHFDPEYAKRTQK